MLINRLVMELCCLHPINVWFLTISDWMPTELWSWIYQVLYRFHREYKDTMA
jgi:hypothetical protein